MTEPLFVTPFEVCAKQRPSMAVAPRSDPSEGRAPMVGAASCDGDATAQVHAYPGACVPSHSWMSPMARFVSSWPTPLVVVVSARGDVDVTNSAMLTDYALVLALSGRGLILDLREVGFFGTEGFSALHRVAVGCARVGTAWSLVPGAAVSRLLGICDPAGLLPAADTVEAALATVAHQITVDHGSSRAS
jgi:anti-anti-sigma regulatory factor